MRETIVILFMKISDIDTILYRYIKTLSLDKPKANPR